MSMSVPRLKLAVALLPLFLPAPLARAQDQPKQAETQERRVPEISDEPRTVDPAEFVPEELAAAVTVEFSDSSLHEMAEWIEDEKEIPVLFDEKALSEAGIPLGEPVTDHLDNEPLYLLLNRLRSLGLTWYVADDVLHITTMNAAKRRMSTDPYNVSDLLDAGYERSDLLETVRSTTPGPWMEINGVGGTLEWLADVLFIRHTDRMHREVRGLLTALREHGRQTFTLDPPQHRILREKLDENVSVSFADTPLAAAVDELAEQTGADIRLDIPAMRESGVRQREPVSLHLSGRKLRTVLHVLLTDLDLTWILRDGVMWITSASEAEQQRKTAVYDVRDLCRNRTEANALKEAIRKQTRGPWQELDGTGGAIVFARSGTLVVRHTEGALHEVGELLNNYRDALRASGPREQEEKSKEILKRYYRMHEKVAADLAALLPRLVQPERWRDEMHPDAPGTIVQVASEPDTNAQLKEPRIPRAVLIIRQTREVHEKIAEVIRRVERGDGPLSTDGLKGGMGGFGGGFFSLP